MRAFIAIELPNSLKEKVARIIKVLNETHIAAKWVKAENLHLTLKFLGQINHETGEQITQIIAETTRGFKSFPADLAGFGFFPNQKQPRILFINLVTQNILESLVKLLEEKLENIGLKKEGRFKSHITLARIKDRKNIEELKEKMTSIKIEGNFCVKEIALIKSTLTSSGPIYENIFKSNLTT